MIIYLENIEAAFQFAQKTASVFRQQLNIWRIIINYSFILIGYTLGTVGKFTFMSLSSLVTFGRNIWLIVIGTIIYFNIGAIECHPSLLFYLILNRLLQRLIYLGYFGSCAITLLI